MVFKKITHIKNDPQNSFARRAATNSVVSPCHHRSAYAMKRAREGSDDGARKKPGNGAGYVHAFPRPAGPVPSSRSIHFCVTVPFCSYLFLPAPPPAAPPQCQPSLTSRSFHSSNYDSQSRGPKLKVEDALAYLAKVSPILLFPFWPICIARVCLRVVCVGTNATFVPVAGHGNRRGHTDMAATGAHKAIAAN